MEKQGVPELHGHEPFTLLLLSWQLVQPRAPWLLPKACGKEYKLPTAMADHATKLSGR